MAETALSDRLSSILGDDLALAFVLADARDVDYPILYASPSFYQLTGYAADDVLGKNCRFLQGPATCRMMVSQLRNAVSEERPKSCVILNYRKDGTPFWNALHIAPGARCSRSGQLLHYIGVQADVSSLVAREAAAARTGGHVLRVGGAPPGGAGAGNANGAVATAPDEVETRLKEEEAAAERIAAQLAAHEGELSPSCSPRCAADNTLPSSMLAALSKLQEAFVLADPGQEGCPLVYASPGFLRLTGYTCSEVLGRNCQFLQAPADPSVPHAEQAAAAAADANAAQLGTLRAALAASPARACTVVLLNFKKHDGARPFLNLLHVAPIRCSKGSLHYFIGCQTELKGGEAVLQQAGMEDVASHVSPLLLLRQKSVVGQVKVTVRSLADGGLRRAPAYQHVPSSQQDLLQSQQQGQQASEQQQQQNAGLAQSRVGQRAAREQH